MCYKSQHFCTFKRGKLQKPLAACRRAFLFWKGPHLESQTAKNRMYQTRYWNKKAGYEGKEDELTPEAKKIRYAYIKGKYREKRNEYGKAYYHRKKAELTGYKRLIEELRKQIGNGEHNNTAENR